MLNRPKSPLRAVLGLVAILALGVASVATAQTIEDEIQAAKTRLTEAKSARLQLVAPRAFETAEAEMAKAQDRYERGGKIEDIQSRLQKVEDSLNRCDELREMGELILRDAFVARDDALEANAPKFAVDLWASAEETIRNSGRRIEDGNQNGARKEATQAVELFRDAELLAIRVDILGSAKTDRERALELKANEYAVTTLADADRDLASAEKVLQGDRYMKAQARELAASAREQFQHAARIAELATKIDRDRKAMPENVIRLYEEQFLRVARELGYEPHFSEGIEAEASQVLTAAKSLSEDRNELAEQVTELQAEIEQLNTTLALLQDRDQKLQQQERFDRKLREIRSLFDASEAEVLLGDSALIIRLYGLSFPVGSSEIRPENFSLLTKLQRALREFPGSFTTIEGHTDSQGNADFNQALSVRRAQAVRGYLLANMDLEEDHLGAKGYGASRPIANNETESGRAKNRRIDIVIAAESPTM